MSSAVVRTLYGIHTARHQGVAESTPSATASTNPSVADVVETTDTTSVGCRTTRVTRCRPTSGGGT